MVSHSRGHYNTGFSHQRTLWHWSLTTEDIMILVSHSRGHYDTGLSHQRTLWHWSLTLEDIMTLVSHSRGHYDTSLHRSVQYLRPHTRAYYDNGPQIRNNVFHTRQPIKSLNVNAENLLTVSLLNSTQTLQNDHVIKTQCQMYCRKECTYVTSYHRSIHLCNCIKYLTVLVYNRCLCSHIQV